MNLALDARMRLIARTKRPIVVGPWRSECGFEILYWLPFLRKLIARYHIDPKRLLVVTRGGASVLYGAESVDLYRLRSVETLRLENAYDWQATKLQKQMRATAWDATVLEEAVGIALGKGTRYHVLHPSLMYRTLAPWWDGQKGIRFLDSLTDYTPIPKPPRAALDLPQNYVAMKWYDRPTWSASDPAVQGWIREVVTTVAAQSPVVLLTGTPATDDHCDILPEGPNIIRVPAADPTENLGQQLRILAHAECFIGTYGGMAQTALRLGVPSASFYRQWGATAKEHLWLSDWLSKRTGVPFLCGSIEDGQAWRRIVTLPVPQMVKQEAA